MSVTTSNRLAKLLEKAPKNQYEIIERKIVNGQAKRVSIDVNALIKRFDYIELSHITDVQWGAHSCLKDKFRKYRDWILSVPNRFVLLGGDMIDAATAMSIASPYENEYDPQEQAFTFFNEMVPMRHRIIGSVGGNHERRTTKTFGDVGVLIATLLKVPYSHGKQLIDIHFGKHRPFKVDLWHGTGSARTKGAKAQMLHRFMGQGDSQLYLVGHLHDVVLLIDWRQHRDTDDVKLEKIAGVMSSSFQSFWGTYAETAGLSPSETMMARAILYADGKWEITLR